MVAYPPLSAGTMLGLVSRGGWRDTAGVKDFLFLRSELSLVLSQISMVAPPAPCSYSIWQLAALLCPSSGGPVDGTVLLVRHRPMNGHSSKYVAGSKASHLTVEDFPLHLRGHVSIKSH